MDEKQEFTAVAKNDAMVTAMVTLYSEEVGGASVEIRTLAFIRSPPPMC